MAEEKIEVYYPETIPEAPFPGQEGDVSFGQSQKGKQEVYSPTTIPDQINPTVKYAHEVLSEALNTKSHKILAEFQFTRFGALQIGEYDPGISGDIRISPNGIVARNDNGETTFALDGDTGDATFAGTIQAGSVITGRVLVGNDAWVIDGNPSKPQLLLFNNSNPEILLGEDGL